VRLCLIAASLLAALLCSGCRDLLLQPNESQLEPMPSLSLEPGYCHSSIPSSLCAQLWMAYWDLANFGERECAGLGSQLLGALEEGKVRYDGGIALANANLATGVITLGQIVNFGWWEIIYAGTHEAKHIVDQVRHACQWGEECRPDHIDQAGLDCANDLTGESRSWLLL
jgi:hypothetical protein